MNSRLIRLHRLVLSKLKLSRRMLTRPFSWRRRSEAKGSAICAIALKEEKYIQEWIEYHLSLGVDRIIIYDNSDSGSLISLNRSYGGRVEIRSILGQRRQCDAYNDFVDKYQGVYRWAAFIDCDEFIVLKTHRFINEFLNVYCKDGGLALSWYFFGSNHRETYSAEPIVRRFIRREASPDKHVKCIVCLGDVVDYSHPHYPTRIEGTIRDCHGRRITGPFNKQPNADIAVVHHYWTKSYEEWCEKVRIRRADSGELRAFEMFHSFNETANEVVDTKALEFYEEYVNRDLMDKLRVSTDREAILPSRCSLKV